MGILQLRNGIFAAGILLVLSVSPLRAADLSSSLPVNNIKRTAYVWTGFYLGGNVGGNITSNFNADTWPATTFSFHDNNSGQIAATLPMGMGGLEGGLQAGYNWQRGAFVVGGEWDIEALKAGGGATMPASGGTLLGSTLSTSASEQLDWLSTIRLRLGYTPFDRWLVYATGGLAFGGVENTSGVVINNNAAYQWSASNTPVKIGYALGSGVEWALTDNISLRFEAYYYNIGSTVFTATGNAAVMANSSLSGYQYTAKTTTAGDIVRIGADYKF